MVRESFQCISAHDEVPLDALLFLPQEKEMRGIVQIAHGMAEHKERYEGFAEFLSHNGYACLIHDHRGHGASIRTQADLGYFGEGGGAALVEDLQRVWDVARTRFSGKKRALLGHSMGTFVAREYARAHDAEIDTLILSGSPSANPMVGAGIALADILTLLRGGRGHSKLLDAMTLGAYGKAIKPRRTEYDWLNIDAAEVDLYIKDPLCGFPFTLNGYKGLFTLLCDTYRPAKDKCKNPRLPILFISGEDDPCMVSRKGLDDAVESIRRRGYENVSLKIYEGQRHEILLSPAKQTVMEDVLRFVDGN
ncbi:MAG: alpha/beta fold hydrolase [Christensenellales bacterium]|jgi:alpha-beta hydrolase superfamily lysophospholipase